MSDKLYYGEKKVISVTASTADTNRSEILFTDGSSINIPTKLLDISVTKNSGDLTKLWDKQTEAVTKEILKILLDYDLQLEQLDYLMNKLKNSIEMNIQDAGDILWGKKLSERRISDVNKVLLSINQKQDGEKSGTDKSNN